MPCPTIKVYVQQFSLTAMQEEGFDLSDNGKGAQEVYSKDQARYILSLLTQRQQQVISLLNEGYSRKETAGRLTVSLQAIHQIVLRIRRRLEARLRSTDA